MHILIVLSALGTIASLTYYLGATFAALRFAYQAGIPAPPLNCRPPRVAMLKPLYSLDADIMEFFVSVWF